jgi:signal transduction histidine kinase
MARILRYWKDLSVAKKLYFVVGVMATLIAVELAILQFSLNTLSAARAFVAGESSWSKAQKDALMSLQRYAITHDDKDYRAYLQFLRIPEGDHRARVELQKPNPDLHVVTEGFRQGMVPPEDIGRMVQLLQRFHWVSYIHRAITHWSEADEKLDTIRAVADRYHRQISKHPADKEISQRLLIQIQIVNEALTPLEARFSGALGEGSRWLENLVLSLLLLAVLTVESIGLTLTFLTSRSLSKGLGELIGAAQRIGQGDFSQRVTVHSSDEIGVLSGSVNRMGQLLENTYKDLEERVRTRTSDLSKLAAENARLYQESKAAVKLREVFLSMASHELRTPFTSLFLQLQMLARQIRQSGGRPDCVALLELANGTLHQARRYTGLLDQLLDLTRLQIGKFELHRERADLSSVVTEMVTQLDADAALKGAQLCLSASRPVVGHFDVTRMGQVATNLVSNAIKYGNGKPVQIQVWAEGERAVLCVKDHGVGIEQDEQNRIFDRFERAATDPMIAGLGLGLFITRQIVEAHGGRIDLESKPGVGSTFTVSLDLRSTPASL